ncbi:MAG: ABC transporter permease subunit [Candidatus Latescibacteria bacterium]|nr:ABC transporter permease subunit [Candidatus Latescibacterota bacterium]
MSNQIVATAVSGNIWALFRKELKAYFNSPIAYVVMTVFLIMAGWFFTSDLFLVGQATMRTFFEVSRLIFVFFVPAVTMRLLAEERASGSLELLVTYPVTDIEIVLAKWLAAMTLLTITLGFTFVYFFTVVVLGNPDEGTVFGGYLGLLLMGGAGSALGLFTSSLTRNQVVAFVLAFAVLFALFMLDNLLVFIPASIGAIVEYLSFGYHLDNLSRGVIDSRDLLYFISLTVMGLALASDRLADRRA